MKLKKKQAIKNKETVWFIRGVPAEVIIAAKKAASKENKFVYQFVSDAVMEISQRVLKGTTVIARPEDMIDVLKDLSVKFDNLASTVNDMKKPKRWWYK